MVLPRDFRLAFLVPLCAALAGCGSARVIETRNFSPETENCSVERYRQSVENNETGVFASTSDSMPNAFSPIAAEIVALPPIAAGQCKIEYAMKEPWPASIVFLVTIIEEQGRLCFEHSSELKKGPSSICFDRP
jgi:hypothetical protein